MEDNKTEWLYVWDDWGLYHSEEVVRIGEPFAHPDFPEEAMVLVRPAGGGRPFHAQAKNLFPTREEAEEHGRRECPRGAWTW